jgi:hypothetical protein
LERLDILVRFWELRARYEATGAPLTEAERLELLSLVQFTASEGDAAPDPQDAELGSCGLPATLCVGNGFLAADLRQVAPELLVVAAADQLGPGQRTIVSVTDAVSGVEYSLPCVVRWTRAEQPCLIGLAVEGAPSRAVFEGSQLRLFGSPLGVRHPERAVET